MIYLKKGSQPEIIQKLSKDKDLEKVFRAVVKINGGPLLRIASIVKMKPSEVKDKLEFLVEGGLLERSTAGSSAASDFSVDYYLTKLAYDVNLD